MFSFLESLFQLLIAVLGLLFLRRENKSRCHSKIEIFWNTVRVSENWRQPGNRTQSRRVGPSLNDSRELLGTTASHDLVIISVTESEFCSIHRNHPLVTVSFGPNWKQWVRRPIWLNVGLVPGFPPLACEEQCCLPLESVVGGGTRPCVSNPRGILLQEKRRVCVRNPTENAYPL